MKYLNIFLLILLLNFIQCPGGGGSSPKTIEDKIAKYLSSGWENFSDGKYDESLSDFQEILKFESDHREGNMGCGWVGLVQDNESMSILNDYLIKGLSDTSIANDCRCGLAAINLIDEKYADAVGYINDVLTDEPSYTFQYKTDIDYRDLLVIKAQSLFFLKQYNNAYEAVLELTTTYIFDPDDYSTWIVDGVSYPAYEGAIAAAISKLAVEYKSI